ncbi:MAG: metallophosphoesterase [Legionella sp.]|nr:metallophosphoesterase [Legionella sp.]
MEQTITHLTDVEGNWRYFNEWIHQSKQMTWNSNQQLIFRPRPMASSLFVYGGDYCDKGPGDLRIGKALNDFKDHYPDSVTLIVGNRDAKCRRFSYELDPKSIRKRLLIGPVAWWQKNKISARDYAIQHMLNNQYLSTQYQDVEAYIKQLSIEQCQAIYLKWMLNETMGCDARLGKPNTFEYRRQELAEISDQKLVNISDEAVTQSFLDAVAPTGQITRYLQHAQLGVIHGDTLFIHGAVTSENMGYVPGFFEATGHRLSDAREWIDALNDWYRTEIQAWIAQPTEGDGITFNIPGYKPLDRYVLFNPKSMVTANWYQKNQLSPISDRVINFLNQAGIYRVISGHQPFSDFPLIIRTKHTSGTLEVIVGDTGYSDPTATEDNRGRAIHQLTLAHTSDTSHVSIEAVRANGKTTKLTLPSRKDVLLGKDCTIGHFTAEGRLLRPGENGEMVSSQLNGFDVSDQTIESAHQQRI